MTQTITRPPLAHSYSRLTVFSGCPLAYKLQYLDRVPAEGSDALEIGAAAHEFFDRWVTLGPKTKFAQEKADIEWDLLEPGFRKLASECFQKEARDQANFKDYLEICQTFAKAYKPDPAYPKVTTEKSVAFKKYWIPCGWYDPEVMFRAKIDRIEAPAEGEVVTKIKITDYKTGYAGSPDAFQLDIYALIGKLLYAHLEKVEVEFYYVRSGFKQTKILETKDLDITKVQIEALIQRIEGEKKWKAKPGARCLICPVAASCTEKPEGLTAIKTMQDAQTLAAEVAFLEAQAKAKKKPLNAWCKEHGKVESGGLVWAHWPTESMVVDIGPFLSCCASFSVDPGKVLNPDSRSIKKACKETPGFSDAIAPYTAIETSTRFLGKKAEEEE